MLSNRGPFAYPYSGDSGVVLTAALGGRLGLVPRLAAHSLSPL
jgi:hypothetical protein